MKDFVFISGNQHKANYLQKWLGQPIRHHKVDVDEIQSLNPREVAEHKARQAYDIIGEPTLVDDVSMVFDAMGQLPGPFIKWFMEGMGNDGLCRMVDGLDTRKAHVTLVYAFYDGTDMHIIEEVVPGQVATEPRGEHGFGWNAVFIPEGSDKTYAEMTDDEVRPFSPRARAIEKLRVYLEAK